MEFKPSARDKAALAEHITSQQLAVDRAVIDEHTAELQQQEHEARQQRAERHMLLMHALYAHAHDIDPTPYVAHTTRYIRARATDWTTYPTSDPTSPLTPECRYVFHDYNSEQRDHSHQRVQTRNIVNTIEQRWRDDTAAYTSKPTIIAHLHHDTLTLLNESRYPQSISTETTDAIEQQTIDDFTATILEPMIASFDAVSV